MVTEMRKPFDYCPFIYRFSSSFSFFFLRLSSFLFLLPSALSYVLFLIRIRSRMRFFPLFLYIKLRLIVLRPFPYRRPTHSQTRIVCPSTSAGKSTENNTFVRRHSTSCIIVPVWIYVFDGPRRIIRR